MLAMMNNIVTFAKSFIAKWYTKIKLTVVRVSVITGIFIVLLWMSSFSYGTFYYAYMPNLSHSKPIYIQAGGRCDSKPEEGLCSFPADNVSLVLADGTQFMIPGQPYKVSLELHLPQSPVNQKLGLFMVHLKLSSRGGKIVRESSRSSMLHYRSELLQVFYMLYYLPLLIMDISEEKQILSVNFFDYYLDDAYQPATYAHIEIQTRFIELYEASLHIHAHFTGLRYLLFNFPVLSAVCGVSSNMVFLSAIALLSWYRFLWARNNRQVVVKVGFDDKPSLEERRSHMQAVLSRQKANTGESRSDTGDAGYLACTQSTPSRLDEGDGKEVFGAQTLGQSTSFPVLPLQRVSTMQLETPPDGIHFSLDEEEDGDEEEVFKYEEDIQVTSTSSKNAEEFGPPQEGELHRRHPTSMHES